MDLEMIFKIKKTSRVGNFLVGVGLKFSRKKEEHIVRTLIMVDSYPLEKSERGGFNESFMDDRDSAWTRGYLISKFRNKEFNYLGFK